MRYNYTLFTNIDYVTIGPARTYTYALLLESNPFPLHDSSDIQCRARGFGTDPAWPVFDIILPSIEYTLSDPRGIHTFISNDGALKPLISCVNLHVEDGPDLILSIDDHQKPLDVQTFAFEDSSPHIQEVWAMLEMKVAAHWDSPAMPRLQWGPPR